ncbi:glutathione synthetase ATP-binding domain-like protein [Haematococcus lacustris]|uniref:Glutathione synthetase ATP-binding domain-like protein n=1 Tax=Haematococcus lacustris TaxID=44745 RepID=A0A699ZGC5_HAELA|nr:glutathione synthetase ATP-binding domain-like protein [Haematococcus lacustris]
MLYALLAWCCDQGDALLDLVALVLRNALVAVDEPELRQAEEQWAWVRTQPAARWGPDWSLAALAALQRTQLSLAAHMDSLHSLVRGGEG